MANTESSPLLRASAQAMGRRYDPERGLVAWPERESGQYWAFASLLLARAWLAMGEPDLATELPKLLDAVQATQITDPDSIDVGNFTWLADDESAEDPNAVTFVLRALLPVLLHPETDGHLGSDRRRSLAATVRLAGEALERIDLGPRYSNIAVASAVDLLLAGQWLDEDRFRQRGRAMLGAVRDQIVADGAPHEYNSPNYGWHVVGPLLCLHQLSDDPADRGLADLLAERLTAHLLECVHPITGGHAGPHVRCYQPQLDAGHGEAGQYLAHRFGRSADPVAPADSFTAIELALLDDLPSWPLLERVAAADAEPLDCRVTVDRSVGCHATTWSAGGLTMGTVNRHFDMGVGNLFVEREGNNWLIQYPSPTGTVDFVTARLVRDGRYLGHLGPAPDRPSTANFYDQGRMVGAQAENRSIIAHLPETDGRRVSSLESIVWWSAGPDDLEILTADGTGGPASGVATVATDRWFVVSAGSARVGLMCRAVGSRIGHRIDEVEVRASPHGGTYFGATLYRGRERSLWHLDRPDGVFWNPTYVVWAAVAGPDGGSAQALLDSLTDRRVVAGPLGSGGCDIELESPSGSFGVRAGAAFATATPLAGGDPIEFPAYAGRFGGQVSAPGSAMLWVAVDHERATAQVVNLGQEPASGSMVIRGVEVVARDLPPGRHAVATTSNGAGAERPLTATLVATS